MEKKERKYGFVNRNPYDLSQSAPSIDIHRAQMKRDSKITSHKSSYTMADLPSRDVIKRIKLRSS